jgi:hypothetical protein
MESEFVFENILERLIVEVGKAQKSIIIVTDFLENKKIVDVLLSKIKIGCTVSLILTSENMFSRENISYLYSGSQVYKILNKNHILENKFFIIDFNTVITGTYNWKVDKNCFFKNILIVKNNNTLAEQFISEYFNILNIYIPHRERKEIFFPLKKIISHLEIIKNYILLEEFDDIEKETLKLREYDYNSDLFNIIESSRKEEFSKIINEIENFKSKNHQLVISINPKIEIQKLEINNYKNLLYDLYNKKIELEKYLLDFQYFHTKELGKTLLDILYLRERKAWRDRSNIEEDENEIDTYRENAYDWKKGKFFELTFDEKILLKNKFRNATIFYYNSHIIEELDQINDSVFIELKQAYYNNDLDKLSSIHDILKKSGSYMYENISNFISLKNRKNEFEEKIINIKKSIRILKESETYNTIISIEDWDDYFKRTKEKLQQEFDALKAEIKD